MADKIEALKPCPFCGGSPWTQEIEPHVHSFVFDGFTMPEHKGSFTVECACGAGFIAETFDDVVALWNRREAIAAPGVAQGEGLTTEQVYAIRDSLEAAAIQIWGVHFVYSSADERVFSQGFRSGWGAREHPTTLARLAAPSPTAEQPVTINGGKE